MDVKSRTFKVPLENWQTVQMPLGKSPEKYPFHLELSAPVSLG